MSPSLINAILLARTALQLIRPSLMTLCQRASAKLNNYLRLNDISASHWKSPRASSTVMNGFIIMFVDCQQIWWEFRSMSALAREKLKEKLRKIRSGFSSSSSSPNHKHRKMLLWILKIREELLEDGEETIPSTIDSNRRSGSEQMSSLVKAAKSKCEWKEKFAERTLQNKRNYNDGIYFIFAFVWVASKLW